MTKGRATANKGVLECPEFDLQMTIDSGQTFHWTAQQGGYSGCIGDTPVFLRQTGNVLYYRGIDPVLLKSYFSFDHDLEAIRESCRRHPISYSAALACRGLRIMRQPHWECIATFILSPMKQVSHIRQMSLALRTSYGNGIGINTPRPFPNPAVIANSTEPELRRCGLGFRAKNLLATAKLVATGEFNPEKLATMNTMDARMELCSLPGIGRKVANCILLFAYERLDVVPVDVWIARILGSFRSRKSGLLQLEQYGEKLLGPYAGYVQQFLFHTARTGKLELPGTSPRSNSTRASLPRVPKLLTVKNRKGLAVSA